MFVTGHPPFHLANLVESQPDAVPPHAALAQPLQNHLQQHETILPQLHDSEVPQHHEGELPQHHVVAKLQDIIRELLIQLIILPHLDAEQHPVGGLGEVALRISNVLKKDSSDIQTTVVNSIVV